MSKNVSLHLQHLVQWLLLVWAGMDTSFKLDTALNFDCDQVLDIILVSDTKQMSRSYKSIIQYCTIKDFFFKIFKNLEFENF